MKLLDQSAQTNWKFIAIVAFVAAFLAGGILLLIPQFQEQPPPLPQPSNSQIEGWQTYRSEEFGFEVKYPFDFKEYELTGEKVYEIENSNILLFTESESGFRLVIQIITNKSSLQEYIDELDDLRAAIRVEADEGNRFAEGEIEETYSTASITIAGQPAIQRKIKSLRSGSLPGAETFVDISPKMIVGLEVYGGEDFGDSLVKLSNQILATFRFID